MVRAPVRPRTNWLARSELATPRPEKGSVSDDRNQPRRAGPAESAPSASESIVALGLEVANAFHVNGVRRVTEHLAKAAPEAPRGRRRDRLLRKCHAPTAGPKARAGRRKRPDPLQLPRRCFTAVHATQHEAREGADLTIGPLARFASLTCPTRSAAPATDRSPHTGRATVPLVTERFSRRAPTGSSCVR